MTKKERGDLMRWKSMLVWSWWLEVVRSLKAARARKRDRRTTDTQNRPNTPRYQSEWCIGVVDADVMNVDVMNVGVVDVGGRIVELIIVGVLLVLEIKSSWRVAKLLLLNDVS